MIVSGLQKSAYILNDCVISHSPPSDLCTPNLQDYTATIFLRQRWTDERLVFEGNKSLSLDGRLVELLWVPDTFIVDSKKSFLHDITVENRLIRIFPNGTVLYALRWVKNNNKVVVFRLLLLLFFFFKFPAVFAPTDEKKSEKNLTDGSSDFKFIVKSFQNRKGFFVFMICWSVLVAKLEMSIDAALGY